MPLRRFSPGLEIQGFTPPLRLRDFALVALDMDAILADADCIAEIADAVGTKEEVAAIAGAAARGEISEARDSLRRRVALLKGATVADLERVCTGHLQLDPGARTLAQACRAADVKVLLVSSGFSFFAERIGERLGADFVRSNVLEIRSGTNCGELTGRMADSPWGAVCDGADKQRMLLQACRELGIAPARAIAMARDANDLPMLEGAGLSVAVHAGAALRAQAMVAIDSGGVGRLLELLA